METENQPSMSSLEAKIEALHAAVEKTRKYMLWSFIIQIAVLFVPLLILVIALPFFLSTMGRITEGLL